MKLRIKTFYNCFEGRQFVIQKRFLFVFWLDVSGWFSEYDNVKDEIVRLRKYYDEGTKV
jgi:hypothetical protein